MNTLEKYSQIYASPFLTGVFMGANAIKDCALYVDGPDCVFYKGDLLYKTHDLNSDLKDPSMDTRLYFSGVMPNKMVRGYNEKIKRKLSFIEENAKFNLGVVTCMPVTGLLATQYDSLYSDFKKDFVFVPSSTDKYWLDGYDIFLKEIAKKIELKKDNVKKKRHISIIGFLFDRNEGDVLGNITEIKRMLDLIGVTVDSIWLDGGNYSDLGKVENSELLVSFPYGESAVKILSKRLAVDSIEVSIPFGLSGIIEFLEKIGEKLNIDKDLVKDVISVELSKIKLKTDTLNEKVFLGKNYIFAGDPNLETSIKDIGEYLGLNHINTFHYTGHQNINIRDIDTDNLDILIGNSDFKISGTNFLRIEFGYPSYDTHYLLDRPFMGFNGFLFFIENLYNRLVLNEKLYTIDNESFFN